MGMRQVRCPCCKKRRPKDGGGQAGNVNPGYSAWGPIVVDGQQIIACSWCVKRHATVTISLHGDSPLVEIDDTKRWAENWLRTEHRTKVSVE